ncbi:MAG: tetratricopeptide repeat protein [Candidatus Margulisbacteria bacterium]|jgi:tetratricopeptide (TPR) repeat protein|nr:tetratricopeptide repeat protein [Candidatus Margulisiibacteriota bacterium]
MTADWRELQTLRENAAKYFAQNYFLQAAVCDEQLIKYNKALAPDIILKYLKAQQENPQLRAELYKAMIKLYLAADNPFDLLDEINEYLDLAPTDPQVVDLLLKLGYAYKQNPLLTPLLAKAAGHNPQNYSLLKTLSGLYLEQGQPKAAIALYENCLKNGEKGAPEMLNILTELHIQDRNYTRAAELYRELSRQQAQAVIDRLELLRGKKGMSAELRFLLAELQIKSKEPDKALEVYEEILTETPAEAENVLTALKKTFLAIYEDYPAAKFLQARIYKIQKNYSEAVSALFKLVNLSPKYYEQVAAELQEIIKLEPRQFMALDTLALISAYQKDFAKSFYYYSRIIDLLPERTDDIVEKAKGALRAHPQVIAAREILAKAAFAKNNYRRAKAEAEAILAIDAKNAGAHMVLGRSQLAMGELEGAVASLHAALSFNPYNKLIHQYYQEAEILMLDRKIADLAKQAAKDRWKYSLHFELGKQYFHRGLLTEAVGEFQTVVRDAALQAEAHRYQGLCYKEMGRYDLAAAQFKKALAKTPENNRHERLKLLFYAGLANEALGHQQEALHLYEEIQLLELNYENAAQRAEKIKNFSWVEIRGKALAAVLAEPGSKRLICSWAKNNESEEYAKRFKNKNIDMSFSMEHNNHAVELALCGRLGQAEEDLLLAEQMDPQFTIVHNNKAVLALLNNKLADAKKYLEQARELNPRVCIIYANLGVYYLLAGEPEKAQENLEIALSLDNTMYLTQLNLGDLYYTKENIPQALCFWQSALQLGVLPELAKRRLKYWQL